ncbi:RpiR family transcriptional regulator [Kitasatospora sp. MMS16-BH015]|uniref:MurR/RpiR family transcriptional regulator n=1 Tax=Kitasatospora sp. MMS16-BH015 TaxID=2018025 RepID=UPI000CA32CAC|nr:MurR/RpiR family transcriptional regulator [Kitasatospora sp. MMS16-BH015]AUG75891.1 RpiR family transcriptional regulator [Kitasatospora sp. MMS16-BH015]
MTSGPLAEEIRRRLGDCSPAERKVGRVLLAGWPAAGFETVAVLAERAGVSAPTVLRFVNRLDFRGFPDFQAALRVELEQRDASPVTLYRASEPLTADSEPADAPALAQQAAAIFAPAVTRTLLEIPPHDLQRAVQLLADPKRRIVLTGGRFTQLLARYLALHLSQMRAKVSVLPDHPVERSAALADTTARDVYVIFDYRRYEPDKPVIAQHVRERGGRVILFTDVWLSPAAPHAEVVLPSQVATPSAYDSLVPTLAVTETLIAAILRTLGDQARTHMQHVEHTARIAGLY